MQELEVEFSSDKTWDVKQPRWFLAFLTQLRLWWGAELLLVLILTPEREIPIILEA